MIDVIKEYLVSLGMSVDKRSFEEANKTIQTVGKELKSFSGSIVGGFAIASTAIVSTLVTANVGIATFLGSLAKADLETEKFARKMWISKDAAESMNNTLKAMGATIEDLYLSPELLRNFHELRGAISEMKPPPEFQNQMKTIRSVQFEFQRMRLEATYALKWVGFYLFKYLEEPIGKIKKGLKGFNDAIIKGMPRWTKNTAQFLSWIVRLGVAMVKAGRDVYRMFDELADHIPDKLKVIGIAVAALGLIIKTGPIGIAMALITGLLLLLDDYYTYTEGGESALAPLWKNLEELYKLLDDTGVIKRFGKALDDAARSAEAGLEKAWDWLVRLYNKFEENGSINNFKEGITTNVETAVQAFKDFGSWVGKVFDELNEDGILSGLEDSFVNLGTAISEIYKDIEQLIQKLYGLEDTKELLQWIGDFLTNTLIVALNALKYNIDNMVNGIKLAKSLLTGDDVGLQQAWEERKELTSNLFDKAKEGLTYLLVDDTAPNPFAKNEPNQESQKTSGPLVVDDKRYFLNATESAKQTDKLNNTVSNLPKGMEPSFKKALNESELVKGFRTFNQDLNKGFNLVAMMTNPDLFEQIQGMAAGGVPSSYMYQTTNSNQTIIKNDNKAQFYITSTEPKAAAQEVNQQWNANMRSVRGAF